MVRKIPPLNALRAFEAAARHSSFSEAGKELSVAHTSVARHVRNLENWLGVKLFRKAGRNIIVTEAGQKYFAETSEIFERIEASASNLESRTKSKVKLSLEPVFAHQWFAKRYYSQNWDDQLEGIELEVISTPKVSDLSKGEADIAIRFIPSPIKDVDGEVFAKQVVIPHMSPKGISNAGKNGKLDALLKKRLLYSHHPKRWRQWFQMAGFPANTPLNLHKQDDLRLGILATISGHGAILISPELVQDEVEKGQLIPASDVSMDHGAYVLMTSGASQGRKEVQKARRFLLDLLQMFGASGISAA